MMTTAIKPARRIGRPEWLQVRMTEAEKVFLANNASSAGLSISDYVRIRCGLPLDNVLTEEYTVTTEKREE